MEVRAAKRFAGRKARLAKESSQAPMKVSSQVDTRVHLSLLMQIPRPARKSLEVQMMIRRRPREPVVQIWEQ